MISPAKFNELSRRVEVLELALAALQKKETLPEGMAPITTLAAEMGISTNKAIELARNCGVIMVAQKTGVIVHEGKFREAALIVIRGAKRRYGSKYWFHPLIGKFQMRGGMPK